ALRLPADLLGNDADGAGGADGGGPGHRQHDAADGAAADQGDRPDEGGGGARRAHLAAVPGGGGGGGPDGRAAGAGLGRRPVIPRRRLGALALGEEDVDQTGVVGLPVAVVAAAGHAAVRRADGDAGGAVPGAAGGPHRPGSGLAA